MRIYLDSSALTKRYISESGSQKINEIFLEAKEIFICVIALPEIISALSRNKKEKKITPEQYDIGKRELAMDFVDFKVCDLIAEVISKTVYLIEKYSLKTLDALHVACALVAEVDMFISSDRKQLSAAQKEKLKVLYV